MSRGGCIDFSLWTSHTLPPKGQWVGHLSRADVKRMFHHVVLVLLCFFFLRSWDPRDPRDWTEGSFLDIDVRFLNFSEGVYFLVKTLCVFWAPRAHRKMWRKSMRTPIWHIVAYGFFKMRWTKSHELQDFESLRLLISRHPSISEYCSLVHKWLPTKTRVLSWSTLNPASFYLIFGKILRRFFFPASLRNNKQEHVLYTPASWV